MFRCRPMHHIALHSKMSTMVIAISEAKLLGGFIVKRTFSFLIAVCLIFSLGMSSFARATVVEPEVPVEGMVELELLSVDVTPRGIIKTFHFNIPADGAYYYFPDFEEEYQEGTKVTFIGTWSPAYVQLGVWLTATATNGGQMFSLSSGVSSERTLYVNSTYTMQLKAIGNEAISGTLQVVIN